MSLSVSFPLEETATHTLQSLVYLHSNSSPENREAQQTTKPKETVSLLLTTFLLRNYSRHSVSKSNQIKPKAKFARNEDETACKTARPGNAPQSNTHHARPFPEVHEHCTIKSTLFKIILEISMWRKKKKTTTHSFSSFKHHNEYSLCWAACVYIYATYVCTYMYGITE